MSSASQRIARRLGQLTLTVLGALIAVHVIVTSAPGEIQTADDSEPSFLRWAVAILGGDLGESAAVRLGAPVSELLAERLPATVLTVLAALGLALVLGVTLGVVWHFERGTRLARSTRALTYLLSAAPTFLLAYWVMVAGNHAIAAAIPNPMHRPEWFPIPIDRGLARYQIACVVLAVGSGVLMETARAVHQELQRIAASEYVLFARASGLYLPRQVRPALWSPFISLAVNRLVQLFGGVVVVELILQVPGLGMLTWTAALRRDWPVLMAVTLVWGLAYAVARLLADVGAVAADPRQRTNGGSP